MDSFQLEIVDGVAVVKVDNAAATMRDAQALLSTFENESIFEWNRTVIDLSKCSFVDSTFIGMIVKIFRLVNDKKRKLKLVFPQVSDIKSFQLVGISKVIDCYGSIQDAVDSFNSDSFVDRIILEQGAIVN